MTRRTATILCSLVAFALLAAGCGDDPAESVGAGPDGVAAPAPSDSTLPDSAEAGTGAGRVTIGSDEYPFDATVCSLTPVRHQARAYEVYVHGEGRSLGVAYEVEVFRALSESGNTIESVRMMAEDGELAAATNIVGEDSAEAQLVVSSSLLSGELHFDGTGDVDSGTGTVELTCG